jgi:hypothetical protein
LFIILVTEIPKVEVTDSYKPEQTTSDEGLSLPVMVTVVSFSMFIIILLSILLCFYITSRQKNDTSEESQSGIINSYRSFSVEMYNTRIIMYIWTRTHGRETILHELKICLRISLIVHNIIHKIKLKHQDTFLAGCIIALTWNGQTHTAMRYLYVYWKR